MTKTAFGSPTKGDSNQSPKLQRLARKLNLALASLDMALPKQRITKALISLCRLDCVFGVGHPEDRFTGVEAQGQRS